MTATKKLIANPRNFDSIVKLYEGLTGRKPSKAELDAARARFNRKAHLTHPAKNEVK